MIDIFSRKSINKMQLAGFTLVELLLVVLILALIAAIALPRFTNASILARSSGLSKNLQTLRSQVELYKAQHYDRYPGETDANNSIIEIDNSDFVRDMTTRTNCEGNQVQGTGESPVNLGPYLPVFPKNPYISIPDNAAIITSGAGICPGNNSSGWYINTLNGGISPNDYSNYGL